MTEEESKKALKIVELESRILFTTLISVLVQKGLITEDEFNAELEVQQQLTGFWLETVAP